MSLTALMKEVGYGSGNMASLIILVQKVEEGQDTWGKCSAFFSINFRAELVHIPKTYSFIGSRHFRS